MTAEEWQDGGALRQQQSLMKRRWEERERTELKAVTKGWGERNLSKRKKEFKFDWINRSMISVITLKVNGSVIHLPNIWQVESIKLVLLDSFSNFPGILICIVNFQILWKITDVKYCCVWESVKNCKQLDLP